MSEPKRMDRATVETIVNGLRQSSDSRALDGARVHIYYHKMPGARPVSDRAIQEAIRAEDLGIGTQPLHRRCGTRV